MTDISVRAEKVGAIYNIPIQIGMDYFDAKFDTGSSSTVISATVFYDGWGDEDIAKLKKFCESKGCPMRVFTSASGHKITGFPVYARDVMVGETTFSDFFYYLIIDGRTEMSLLGDDFIDNCRYVHEPHSDIQITAFDFDNYDGFGGSYMENDEILGFIDGLVG